MIYARLMAKEVATNTTNIDNEKIDFFLVSAHEIRTSLAALKWFFKMLLDEDLGPLTPSQRAMIEEASLSNERMVGLLNDTMNVIRAEGSPIQYAKNPILLKELVDESIKDFTSEAAEKGMHIRATPPPIPVTIIGDAPKLRIVLHNILENAIKYGTPNTDIAVSYRLGESTVRLDITDHGIPIPTEEQSSMFTKFFRASNARKSAPGVGLGLYATKVIAERHGGTIGFTSSETETTFSLTLPISS